MSTLRSPFLQSPIKLPPSVSSSLKPPCIKRLPAASYPRIRAINLDQNTIVTITVGVDSVAVGIGIPVFYETQIVNAPREKTPSRVSLAMAPEHRNADFFWGTGSVTVELSGEEKEVSRCINCDGAGSPTCTTCQGSGIQPRYLDRRESKDDDE